MTLTDDVKLCECTRCHARLISPAELKRHRSARPPANTKVVGGWLPVRLAGVPGLHHEPACATCLKVMTRKAPCPSGA